MRNCPCCVVRTPRMSRAAASPPGKQKARSNANSPWFPSLVQKTCPFSGGRTLMFTLVILAYRSCRPSEQARLLTNRVALVRCNKSFNINTFMPIITVLGLADNHVPCWKPVAQKMGRCPINSATLRCSLYW
jgi:hypothetical protein